MKYILGIFIVLTLTMCSRTDSNSQFDPNQYSIRIIDGCEYIEVENSTTFSDAYSYTLTHKGNCKNPIHRCPCKGQ